MKIDGSAVRTGMVLDYDNKLYVVVKHEIRTPGNLRAFNQVEMKDVKTGIKTNNRFNSGESVERVSLDQKNCNFLYAEGNMLVFMDNESYEQFNLSKDMLGESLAFLQDGMTVSVEFHDETPLSVKLPEKLIFTIAETDPVVKGQTAASSYKPAILDNGVRVMVPPFLDAGERIWVNTSELTYLERAKKGE